MDNLPIESSRSFKEGSWFLLKDGTDSFRLWVSSTNGKEKFYYNEDLLEERQQRTKFKTVYKHENAAGDEFEVVLKVTMKLNNAGSICTLTKNGELIGRVEMLQNRQFMRQFRFVLYPTALLIVLTVLSVRIGNYSDWLILLPILYFVIGIIFIITRKVPMMKIADTSDLIDD